jgi:thiamine-phosphate diphosphorylase/hydroxyethylthiazole kinase
MAPPTPDYSVYLVTARSQVPAGVDYLDALRAALKGGVTLVQIREKDIETDEFLDIARKSLAVCDEVSAERQEHRELLKQMEEKGCPVLRRD